MRKESGEFLEKLLSTPSPSGFEAEAQRLFLDYVGSYADETTSDVHGNAAAVLNPSGKPRVMLAGHIDQIGLIVKYITEDGFIYFDQIGGLDPMLLPAQRVLIHAEKGPVLGVVGRKPIHLLEGDERKSVPKMKDQWIDIGARKKKEAERMVAIGDPVTFDVPVKHMPNSRMISAGFDDKAGVYVIAEAARLLSRKKIKAAVHAVATVQEEVGIRGAKTSAFGIDAQVGIAVDVTFAGDSPDTDKKQVGDIRLGKGPVVGRGANFNPVLYRRVLTAARKHKIPYQISAEGNPPGTDAYVMQVNRAGMATALISVPNRYMHSPCELVHVDDLENISKLIAHTCASIDDSTDFIPS